MITETDEVNIFDKYMKTNDIDINMKFNYKNWVSAMGLESNQQYHSIMKEIVTWTKGYHDDVLECLLCLLIFFSQCEGEPFSQNIERIQQSWR